MVNFKSFLLVALILTLTGCSSSQSESEPIIPKSDVSMKDIYDNRGRPDASHSKDLSKVSVIKRPATEYEMSISAYDVNGVGERPQFRKLPNPTLYIYFPPKLTSDGRMPIPAWMTEFKMYDRDEYALPGELNLGGHQ